ncbi:MAG: carbamoyl-phosphate synthase (glutamine-hydrolyzing) large subunit [Clostridiales bacterium]|nr:carbamoyl-phosphate synthase (glutamine-hydrolyzing) large subunit [Clostridiales bacterium]
MPKNESLKKVLMISSGPIVIGQAAEFDYAGTQACKSIREEGIECVLVNSNPATIMTDDGIADKVYMEPLTDEALEAIIERERPQGVLAGFGGQTGLNLAMSLDEKGVLAKYGAALLGVNRDSIKKAEDREEFRALMRKIGEPVPRSTIANCLEDCGAFIEEVGFPVVIRPAYTLGGTGGGIAKDERELETLVTSGVESSAIGQILLEESVAGWKELEFEVMRDAKDNCITICGMENFDPVGVHTGDSIVVAPMQTLTDDEYKMQEAAAHRIVRSLGIEGGCNVQLALDPVTNAYVAIEVNPRVSRSSALASKATGFPIAKIAAKIALGYSLDELKNYSTGKTAADFDPVFEYCVVKFPRWPFEKFKTASRKLGTQMKATGEVMSISHTFESALLKAITSLEIKMHGLRIPYIMQKNDVELVAKIEDEDDERIFAIAEALRRDSFSIDRLYEITKIDKWFLGRLDRIVKMEKTLAGTGGKLSAAIIHEAEDIGFTDNEILSLSGAKREVLTDIRVYNDIFPVYKAVSTFGGESEASNPYYYSCFEEGDESVASKAEKVLIVGSGPIRIGQGIEFDYCCVRGVWAAKELGYEAVIINNNPETVSTDFDTSDKLYFEALHIDDVMNVIKKERPLGVVLQFGGQTSLNLAEDLDRRGMNILGTSFESIDLAEDRQKTSEFLAGLGIKTPPGYSVTTKEAAMAAVKELGYPLVVRPSYVIGGRAMQVVYSDVELLEYLSEAVSLSDEYPVLIDKYIEGKEIEVDAISDGEDILIPGIMEHVERTGVHSGDSISAYPPHTLPNKVADVLVDYTNRITRALKVCGLVNIQYAWEGNEIYVIEINPRASRTVPIISKVTGVPMVKLAVAAMLGHRLRDSEFGVGLYRKKKLVAVKLPVFSGAKLTDVDIALGPEMKSTGEVLGIDESFEKASYKGFLASGVQIPAEGGGLYVRLRDPDKNEASAKIIRSYADAGFDMYSYGGTLGYLQSLGLGVSVSEADAKTARRLIADGVIKAVFDVPNVANRPETDSFEVRRYATERNLPVLTCVDTAELFLLALSMKKSGAEPVYRTLEEYMALG